MVGNSPAGHMIQYYKWRLKAELKVHFLDIKSTVKKCIGTSTGNHSVMNCKLLMAPTPKQRQKDIN